MPEQYVAMRDEFKSQGLGDAEAKTKAAKIYNSSHPGAPVTRNESKNQALSNGGTMAYSKGGMPQDASYAQGGMVLGRTRDFLKEPVEFRKPEEGMRQSRDVVGDTADEDQKYAKEGAGKGAGFGPKLDRACLPNKQLKTVKPRS